MSAGTLTLTNNSAAVSGSGTAFTTELSAGDFIVVTVGGVPYTLPVKSVESGTALTLVSNFTGPTQAGAAWSAVPRVALNMVTAALVAQSAEALRGLNYDKQNWQSIFSLTGNVTITLPDGSTWNGPAWNSVAKKGDNSDITSLNALTTPLSISQGGTGAQDKAGSRLALGITDLGLGSSSLSDLPGNNPLSGFYQATPSSSQIPPSNGTGCAGMHINGGSYYGFDLFGALGGGARLFSRTYEANTGTTWREFYSNGNTTVDTNGNLKPSSPVIRLKGDGTAELNDESAGVMVERIGTGVYKITGVLGFNADPIWGGANGGYVIPDNANGLPLLWVDYEIDPDGSITLRTYHRTHHSAPEFARNLIGIKNEDGSFTETVQDGEPVDIPAGRWVDLRVEMPRNSLWNIKQQEVQEARKMYERERQQNQQAVQ